ncbi:MAG: hypothetical protein ACON4H_08255 [Rubripirellula sp.]
MASRSKPLAYSGPAPISIRTLFAEAFSLVRDQYPLFLLLCSTLIFIGVLSPLGALLGPSLACIHTALDEKKRTGKANLKNISQWFSFSLDAILAYMMILAASFLFLAPTSLLVYNGLANWELLRNLVDLPDPVLLGMVAMLVPTVATIQITFCVPFLFTFTSMARSKVSAVNAIKLSIQTTTQNLAIVLKVAALLMLLHIIASIAFLLPAALLLPLHYAVIHQLHFRLTN